MILCMLLCMTVFVQPAMCGHILEDGNTDNQLKSLCNRDIPEDQSVYVGEECRTSQNCQQLDVECVPIRENYCLCQLPEERMRRRRRGKKFCKKNKGHSCSRKLKCQKKYRKRGKICLHPAHICCTKCKNLKYHSCTSKKFCMKGSVKEWYQCERKSNVCCMIVCGTGMIDGSYCEMGRCPCTANARCTRNTCKCDPGYTVVNGACEPECGTGMVDGSYCADTRCQCTTANAVCTANTCQCDSGYAPKDRGCVGDTYIGIRQVPGEQWKYTWRDGSEVTAVGGQLFNDGTDGNGYQNWESDEQNDGDESAADDEECVRMDSAGT